MPSDIQDDVDIVVWRDLGGTGPIKGVAARCSAETIAKAKRGSTGLWGGDAGEIGAFRLFVLTGVSLALPLLLLFLPANRSRRARWILVPHGVYVVAVLVAWMTGNPESIIGAAAIAFVLTTFLLGAGSLEGRSRLLLVLIAGLLPASVLGIIYPLLFEYRGGVEGVSAIASFALAPGLVFATHAFFARWRYRWWLFLGSLILSVLLWVCLLIPVAFLLEIWANAVNLTFLTLSEIRAIAVYLVRRGTLWRTSALVAFMLPHLVLCFTNRFYRDRLFAIYRRPGMTPPEGFASWREFEEAHRETPRPWVARVVAIGLAVAVAFVYGSGLWDSVESATYSARTWRPTQFMLPERIGPDTPLDAQRPDIAMPDFPEEITSTTFPTRAVVGRPDTP